VDVGALNLVIAAAEEAGKAEPSKTAFYIAGGLLATWAVVLAAVGLRRAEFPGSATGARLVMLVSAVLVAAAMSTAVITS
jgi:hypothetical protein